MLHTRRPLPLILLLALAGASLGVAAAPPDPGRGDPPQARKERAQQHGAPERVRRNGDENNSRQASHRQSQLAQRRARDNEDALSDSIRRIERTTRGQVLSAERVPYDGRNLNRIKVVDDRGRVRVYMDDPQAAPDAPTRSDDD